MPATAPVVAKTNMALTVASNWRLGSDVNPGYFDVSDLDQIKTRFSMSTIFRLRWQLPDPNKDQIYNLLHSITLGWQHKSSKIHIEQLAQILHGELHVTSRFTDHRGCVHRNTQPLLGGLGNVGQWFQIKYSGQLENNMFCTTSDVYNHDTNTRVQQCNYCTAVDPKNFEFYTWDTSCVPCDYEMFGVPRNHVMVNGYTLQPDVATFDIQQVHGSIGNADNSWYCTDYTKQEQSKVNYRYSNTDCKK